MNPSVIATQPAAIDLLDHSALMDRLSGLRSNPRVWLGIAGCSHGGREIPYIVVALPDVIERLEYYRQAARSFFAPDIHYETLGTGRSPTTIPSVVPATKVPVMIVGASFGNEAAHTEAIVELAERLATSDDPAVREILGRVITVLIPLMNPDGRETALEEWRQYPLSAALGGSVNAWGSMLNRDFLALTQPESRAVLSVFREWHPVAGYDPHEDMYMLGVSRPQSCWTPPFARPTHPEIHPAVLSCIDQMGNAIADAWRANRFNMLHDPNGNHDFMNLFRLGGRFHLCLALHGAPALITESARTPGSQTWDERKRQKTSAALAILALVARQPERFVDAIARARAMEGGVGAFVVPTHQNDESVVRELLTTLLAHEVQVYRAETPYAAYLIPQNQPEGRLVRSLLGTEGWNSLALPPALGVTVLDWNSLDEAARIKFAHAPLHQVLRLPRGAPTSAPRRSSRGDGAFVIPNSVEGMTALNALWRVGAEAYWATTMFEHSGSTLAPGSLVVKVPVPGMLKARLARGHRLDAIELPPKMENSGLVRLRIPRIGVYVGPGVDDRYALVSGDTRWACQRMGFPHVEITGEDMRPEVIAQFDVLIMPGGDAEAIVAGWNSDQPWQRAPWQVPHLPGIGQRGIAAIRQFVEQGGSYVGLGCGGASLAGTEYAGLVELTTVDHSLGEGRVRVSVEIPQHPIMAGCNGTVDVAGTQRDPVISAYYYSERAAGIKGGPIFAVKGAASILATYAGLQDATTAIHFSSVDALAPEKRTPAIVHAERGKGRLTLFSISPDFRGIWLSTFPLIGNAILLGAMAQER